MSVSLKNDAPQADLNAGPKPNDTDAMGIKAVTGLPGSKQAELTSPDVSQQAATQPGSGKEVTEGHHGLFHHGHKGEDGEGDGDGKLGFKDQVKAYAKIHRGTITRNEETKELGKQILSGEVAPPAKG